MPTLSDLPVARWDDELVLVDANIVHRNELLAITKVVHNEDLILGKTINHNDDGYSLRSLKVKHLLYGKVIYPKHVTRMLVRGKDKVDRVIYLEDLISCLDKIKEERHNGF